MGTGNILLGGGSNPAILSRGEKQYSAVVWAFDLCVPFLFFPFHPRAYLLPVLANQEKTVLNNVI